MKIPEKYICNGEKAIRIKTTYLKSIFGSKVSIEIVDSGFDYRNHPVETGQLIIVSVGNGVLREGIIWKILNVTFNKADNDSINNYVIWIPETKNFVIKSRYYIAAL